MSRAFSTVAHDYGKPLLVTFRYTSSAAGSLSDVITPGTPVVVVIAPPGGGVPLVNRAPATIAGSADGVVTLRYDWSAPQTDTPGRYEATFEVAAPGGPFTLPVAGTIPVLIRDDLG